MSYRIEYQWVGLRITSDICRGLREPRFVIAIEGGCNNLYTDGNNGVERRARSWEIGMIGTETQVLRQATLCSSSCESGDLKPGGRNCTPEAYLRRIRRALDQALEPEMTMSYLGLGAQLPADHPVVLAPAIDGFTYYPESYLDEVRVRFIPTERDHWAAFFETLDPYLDDLSLAPHRLGQIWGLPRS